MFWQAQHLRNLPELASWTNAARERAGERGVLHLHCRCSARQRASGALVKLFGYRGAIAFLLFGLGASMFGAFIGRADTSRWSSSGSRWSASSGRCVGLFTCTCRRCSRPCCGDGAGFCYNVGRIVAAGGTVFFGLFANVGNFRLALLYAAALLVPASILALLGRTCRSTDRRRQSSVHEAQPVRHVRLAERPHIQCLQIDPRQVIVRGVADVGAALIRRDLHGDRILARFERRDGLAAGDIDDQHF